MNMEPTENTAAVLHGPMDMRMEHFPAGEVGPNDVLLKMGSVGICGSDLKYWKYGVCGRFTVTSPMVIGHEGSGTVVKTGTSVRHLQLGDRVAIEPGVPCRKCTLCKKGKYNLCPDIRFCATPPVHGNLCRYYVHPADFCFRLPEKVSLDEGALMEPLAVAVYSCERGNVDMGDNIFISGAGPVGLLVMMVAKAKGCSRVVMTDIDESRLQFAKELKADFVINVASMSPKETASEVVEALGCRPDCSFECSGSDIGLNTCVYATESGGAVVMVGRGSLEPATPLVEAASREVDIRGIFRYANCYPKALSLVAGDIINVKPLVSHRYSFRDSYKAFETASDRSSGAIKVVIDCNQ